MRGGLTQLDAGFPEYDPRQYNSGTDHLSVQEQGLRVALQSLSEAANDGIEMPVWAQRALGFTEPKNSGIAQVNSSWKSSRRDVGELAGTSLQAHLRVPVQHYALLT